MEEPRSAPAGGADREDEAGPPLASPAGQSEPGSPVAAPFFLLYPGDGGAGFVARPPPQQQRSWRTPPSPGSPLPFLLLNYPSGGGGGGKHQTKTPIQVDDGHYMLTTSKVDPILVGTRSLRFLKHQPVTSPPTNQKKVHELITHPTTLSSKTVFKNPCLKAIREFGSFEHELPILLA
ncbi:hypothetical protein J1605_007456 [Eschrichtius robustus]|uniref:Uncharacterized protein n=1 Tax=Eschrichtius robustus TaxID=9764 RepID=A0AB34GXL9_ESCRO|nr:hypothetical protein J1605_007456 [Eschrichtius robustus]